MIKPAIVVVGYNRCEPLKRLLNFISKANYSGIDNIPLIISLDKSDNSSDILKIANDYEWNFGKKIIRTFNERQGLRKHVIQCGDLSLDYDAVIILEDDLVVSPNYYKYVVDALEFYKDDNKIAGIALYSHEWNGYANRFFQPISDEYDTYMGQFSITWGQCWTKESWINFKNWYKDKENRLGDNVNIPSNINKWSEQSWGRYFVNYIIEKDLYYVIPRISLTTNFTEVGQHAKKIDTDHQVRILNSKEYQYKFATFAEAQKYDIFFENRDLYSYFDNDISKEGITIDLNGFGRKHGSNRYILTTMSLPFIVVSSFGIQMRPIDMNIVNQIKGNDIYLYDTTSNIRSKKQKNSNIIMRYEMRGIPYRKLIKYISSITLEKMIRKVKK